MYNLYNLYNRYILFSFPSSFVPNSTCSGVTDPYTEFRMYGAVRNAEILFDLYTFFLQYRVLTIRVMCF